MIYRFGAFGVDPDKRLLLREGTIVPLTPKALDVLLFLLRHRARVCEKAELMDAVWRDIAVEESNLTVCVSMLRRALGETLRDHQYVVTFPGRGYQFVAPVVEHPHEAAGEMESRDSRAPRVPSVAVLQFDPLSADETTSTLGAGIANGALIYLKSVEHLEVRSSLGNPKSPVRGRDGLAAARRLGATAALGGTVQIVGDRVRVTAQLVDSQNGAALWVERFDERLTELLALEDSVSERIARSLARHLRQIDPARSAAHTSPREAAHQASLKGRYFWNKRTEEGLRKALEYFQAAIASDAEYAPPYAGLADCYNLLCSYGAVPPHDACPLAVEAATKALALDGRLAEAHTSLGYSRFIYDWDWSGAETAFTRAIELNPDYATAHHLYSDYLTASGRFDEALAALRRAQKLEPLSLIINTDISWVLFHARRYAQARQRLAPTLEMDPAFPSARWVLGLNLLQDGRHAEAIGEFQAALRIFPDSPFVLGSLGHAFAVVGQREDALRVIDELDDLAGRHYVSPYHIATIYAGLAENDLAFQYLEQAYGQRAHWLTYMNVVPLLDSLRDDPRFEALAARVGHQTALTKPDVSRPRASVPSPLP